MNTQAKHTNAPNALTAGTNAHKAGKSVAKNPYPAGSMNHSHWRTGWRISEDEKRLDNDRRFREQ